MRISVSILLLVAICLCRAQTLSNNPGGPEQSVSSHCVFNGTACSLISSQTSRSTIITRPNSTLPTAPSTTVSLPTTPYTGQSLLTGSCSVPTYSEFALPAGGCLFPLTPFIVPLIGCSDDRPECCPSVSIQAAAPTSTLQSQDYEDTATCSNYPTPTGVVSILRRAPSTMCPSGMVDVGPVCWRVSNMKQVMNSQPGNILIWRSPSSFTLYEEGWPGEVVGGYTLCVGPQLSTQLPSPSPPIFTAPYNNGGTWSLANDHIYAIGLPCTNCTNPGLSTDAKVGIGVGVGVGVPIVIAVAAGIWLCVKHRRRKELEQKPDHIGPVGREPQE